MNVLSEFLGRGPYLSLRCRKQHGDDGARRLTRDTTASGQFRSGGSVLIRPCIKLGERSKTDRRTNMCKRLSSMVMAASLVGVAIPASHAFAGSCASSCGAKKSNTIVDTAKSAGSFKTLTAALQASGLDKTLAGEGPFTVFAPTDDAFAKLPKGTVEGLLKDPPKLRSILKHHVVPGRLMASHVLGKKSLESALGQHLAITKAGGARIGGSKIISTDVLADNGVIHVIDAVMMPKADLIDVARNAGAFKTLDAAITAAGLGDALRSKGPFTVFAPTDEAFAKLPAGTLQGLLKDPEKLRSILLYHVVPGKVLAADVRQMHRAQTLEGSYVTLRTSSPTTVNGATILKTDIMAANGVIHVIDKVIVPPEKSSACK